MKKYFKNRKGLQKLDMKHMPYSQKVQKKILYIWSVYLECIFGESPKIHSKYRKIWAVYLEGIFGGYIWRVSKNIENIDFVETSIDFFKSMISWSLT